MSHDPRTPLNRLWMRIDTMGSDTVLQQRSADHIHEMNRMIDDTSAGDKALASIPQLTGKLMIDRHPIRALLLAATFSLDSLTAHALTALEQANKDTVLAFYEAAINQKDVEAAVGFIGPKYIQHNPRAADGVDGLRGFISGYLKKANPGLKAVVKRVVVQGDLVVLHVHSLPEPGALGSAIVDIFPLENGKIVAHWDVMQPVPDKQAHSNTIF